MEILNILYELLIFKLFKLYFNNKNKNTRGLRECVRR